MSSCCHEPKEEQPTDHCHTGKRDWLLWICISIIIVSFIGYYAHLPLPDSLHEFAHASVELMGKMWWGIVIGAVFVGLLDYIPQELVTALLGGKNGFKGLLRATFAGLLLDLCSHGILLVGMKLYKRGATLGQTMAFLIASPWNSFSLTIILFALIGFKWTMLFIALSAVMALISGAIFDRLVKTGKLPDNPNTADLPQNYKIKEEFKGLFAKIQWFNVSGYFSLTLKGFKDSKSILKWLFLGIVLAAGVRAFVPIDMFQTYLGPTGLGLALSIIFATIIEVCSEGTTPIAADIFTRAAAPGNAFAFLMTGVATDYTEIMSIKETTKSWKIALFLPLITVPQVIILAIIMNQFSQ